MARAARDETHVAERIELGQSPNGIVMANTVPHIANGAQQSYQPVSEVFRTIFGAKRRVWKCHLKD